MASSIKTTLTGLACLLLLLLLSGCASRYGAATIMSEPSGAEVINTEDGNTIGVTPLTLSWKDSSSNRQYVALRIKKSGYEPNLSHFWLSMRHRTEHSAKMAPQEINVILEKK